MNTLLEIQREVTRMFHDVHRHRRDGIAEQLTEDFVRGYITQNDFDKNYEIMWRKIDRMEQEIKRVSHALTDWQRANPR